MLAAVIRTRAPPPHPTSAPNERETVPCLAEERRRPHRFLWQGGSSRTYDATCLVGLSERELRADNGVRDRAKLGLSVLFMEAFWTRWPAGEEGADPLLDYEV